MLKVETSLPRCAQSLAIKNNLCFPARLGRLEQGRIAPPLIQCGVPAVDRGLTYPRLCARLCSEAEYGTVKKKLKVV